MKVSAWLTGIDEISPGFLNTGLLVLRILTGLFIAFAHGINKIPPSEGFINLISSMGFPFAVFFAWIAALSEFAGGLLLIPGLLTRPSAFMLSITMLVAAFLRHAADPFARKELALLYFFIFLFLLLLGGGKFSLDYLLRKKFIRRRS
jgi:putative oxidoreductase